jgi:acyl dehydratase
MTEAKQQTSAYGVLTDAGVDRLRAQLGIQYDDPTPPHNYEGHMDAFRHMANGYGDGNPLWSDREYAKKTRWGGLVAPPMFVTTMGEKGAPKPTPEQKAALRGDPLAGLGSYQAVQEFEWYAPIREGDHVTSSVALVGVVPKANSAFSGSTVGEMRAWVMRNQAGVPVVLRRGTWIRAERHASKAREKKYELPQPYTPEQLAEIDAAYAAETIRGAEVRYWEDVQPGEEMPTIVRGPLRTTDIVVWHAGVGMGITPPGAFKLSYDVRAKVPGLFTPNALNIPDTVQRLHWEKEWANQLGIPISYDYGAIREAVLTNLVTNWMGDDGWLWKLSCQHRKFVYQGDTYWVKGRVRDKAMTDAGAEVRLEIWVQNQWGTITSPGEATVLLPTRDKAVTLPRSAETDAQRIIDQEVERNRPLDTHVSVERRADAPG